ncbi:MAG TPA: hypothetical protein ENK66_09855 [Arcobacter sp.]|nr:hypothetical protein [Arcobacter sp.]
MQRKANDKVTKSKEELREEYIKNREKNQRISQQRNRLQKRYIAKHHKKDVTKQTKDELNHTNELLEFDFLFPSLVMM